MEDAVSALHEVDGKEEGTTPPEGWIRAKIGNKGYRRPDGTTASESEGHP